MCSKHSRRVLVTDESDEPGVVPLVALVPFVVPFVDPFCEVAVMEGEVEAEF